MNAYIDDATLMVDLMLGYGVASGVKDELNTYRYELAYSDARHLREIADHVRAQLISIIGGMRRWEKRHEELRHPMKRRYSTLQGILIRQDLRQHWILYRSAHGDYLKAHRLCHERMRKVKPTPPRRRTKKAA